MNGIKVGVAMIGATIVGAIVAVGGLVAWANPVSPDWAFIILLFAIATVPTLLIQGSILAAVIWRSKPMAAIGGASDQ